MSGDLWLLLIIALFGLVRVWWERREDDREAERQRRMMDIGRNL
jgi:hypothetical protein